MAIPAPRLAKLSRPRLFDALPRERLFAVLDALRQRHSIVWISAQPGAGKTTLVASYLAARRAPSIWYQVDTGEADPATFFYYLGQAAKTLPGKAKRLALPLLTPEYLPNLDGFSRTFFRTLYSRIGRGGILVLDNYQEAPDESAFHQVMSEGLGEIPEEVTVIIASRVDPSSRYSRFIANKRLYIVGWDQMRLTLSEAEGIAQLQAPVDRQTIGMLRIARVAGQRG